MYEILLIEEQSEWLYEIHLIQSNGGHVLTKKSQVKYPTAERAHQCAMYIIDSITYTNHLDAYRQFHISDSQE